MGRRPNHAICILKSAASQVVFRFVCFLSNLTIPNLGTISLFVERSLVEPKFHGKDCVIGGGGRLGDLALLLSSAMLDPSHAVNLRCLSQRDIFWFGLAFLDSLTSD